MREYIFELTLVWANGQSTKAKKVFVAGRASRAWGCAKRWRENCIAICGKDQNGNLCQSDSLVLTK